jgi:hypothetical protein
MCVRKPRIAELTGTIELRVSGELFPTATDRFWPEVSAQSA